MPTLLPFTFHWYDGVVPPLVGVAVKVTLVPEQIVVLLVLMPTLAVKLGFMVIVSVFEVAVALTKQGVAFDRIAQVTASPLTKVVVEKVGLSVPTLVPLIFH